MIIGAGLAGLIAAHAFGKERVVEAAPAPAEAHKALLRFRTDEVSKLTGIPFKQVTVRKGIFYGYNFCEPNIQLANMYAKKVVGKLVDRSIWNLDAAKRYIAPDDFYFQLVDNLQGRIEWGAKVDFKTLNEPAISTAPLPVMVDALGLRAGNAFFERAAIRVERYQIRGANVYQTVYFPASQHSLYRASITGDLLICEFCEGWIDHESWKAEVFSAFGIAAADLVYIDTVEQKYGKILPIDEAQRRKLVIELSENHNIYSLGRFATWRNILLDDLVNDVAVIKKLMHSCGYGRKLIGAK